MKNKASEIIKLEAASINGLIDNLTSDFDRSVELILQCPGRVVVSGMGKSGLIGKKISATLASTGTPSFFMHPAEAIHGDLGMLKKEDLLLAISNSGETDEILKMLPYAKKNGVRIIGICGKPGSYLAINSDCFLNSSVKKEAGIIGLAPTCSTTAQLVLGDALAIAVSEARSFEAKDFAQLHPGGTLGRKLLGYIKDVMHTGVTIPKVSDNLKLIDAVKEITDKRLGFCVVTDRNNEVLGIVTDGDLRRIIMRNKNKDIWNMEVSSVMSKNPKTVQSDILIAEALELMEQKQITSLVVASSNNILEGVVHLHDLLGRGNVKISI
ncbi:MAG: KpsF/GutQ family sugar-phosphate isomerase [Candidatus Muiribacteriota bacterium]